MASGVTFVHVKEDVSPPSDVQAFWSLYDNKLSAKFVLPQENEALSDPGQKATYGGVKTGVELAKDDPQCKRSRMPLFVQSLDIVRKPAHHRGSKRLQLKMSFATSQKGRPLFHINASLDKPGVLHSLGTSLLICDDTVANSFEEIADHCQKETFKFEQKNNRNETAAAAVKGSYWSNCSDNVTLSIKHLAEASLLVKGSKCGAVNFDEDGELSLEYDVGVMRCNADVLSNVEKLITQSDAPRLVDRPEPHKMFTVSVGVNTARAVSGQSFSGKVRKSSVVSAIVDALTTAAVAASIYTLYVTS